jgi:hypothetical protein
MEVRETKGAGISAGFQIFGETPVSLNRDRERSTSQRRSKTTQPLVSSIRLTMSMPIRGTLVSAASTCVVETQRDGTVHARCGAACRVTAEMPSVLMPGAFDIGIRLGITSANARLRRNSAIPIRRHSKPFTRAVTRWVPRGGHCCSRVVIAVR